MLRMRSSLVIILSIVLLASCSKRSLTQLKRRGLNVTRSSYIQSPLSVTDSVRLQYLGCGGFYIQQNHHAILIDPFFSHQPFMRIGRSIFLGGKIKPMTTQLRLGKKMILDSLNLSDQQLRERVKGIFSAHGHYDHLMDVPFIHHEWLGEKAQIFVNTSAAKTISQVVSMSKLHDIEKIASVRNQKGDSIAFENHASSIRVYPIFADHNPHSRNIKLFAGSATAAPGKYSHYINKTRVNDWLEGQTLSFLIDLVKDDKVYFRMFLQSSSCQFPNGMPPSQLLQEKPVDLAVLGVASYHFSENTYPCEFLNALKPAHLMFIHWEDFFRKVNQRTKSVKMNNTPRFFSEIFSKCKMDYFMPVPGSVFTIGN